MDKLPNQIVVRVAGEGTTTSALLSLVSGAERIFLLKRSYTIPSYYYAANPRLVFIDAHRAHEIVSWHMERRSRTPSAPPGVQGYYHVPGNVPRVLQASSHDCWAASAAMMLSWRDQETYDTEQAAEAAGQEFVDLLHSNGEAGGILPENKRDFLARLGLVAEAPQTFTIEGLRELLEEHGPLWVTVDVGGFDNPSAFLPHARVIVAIDGDGTKDRTYLTYLDPDADSEVARQSVQNFTTDLERIARGDLRMAGSQSREPFRPQIIHF